MSTTSYDTHTHLFTLLQFVPGDSGIADRASRRGKRRDDGKSIYNQMLINTIIHAQ